MRRIAGTRTFVAYIDKRGLVNIENKHTRNLSYISEEDWREFVQIVLAADNVINKKVVE